MNQTRPGDSANSRLPAYIIHKNTERGDTMFSFNRISLVAVACLTVAATANGDIVISDQTFNSADWSTTVYTLTGGATEASSQQLSGGNPDEYRRMTHMMPGLSNIGVFHAFQTVTYDPAVSGSIQSIDYREDQIEFFPPFTGAAIGAHPALRQDGVIYFGPSITYSNTSWQTATLFSLTASDFLSSGSSPDFGSTGGVIEFGFSRSNTNTSSTTYSLIHGIDNWSVSITTVPEPSTFALLLGGIFTVALRRHRTNVRARRKRSVLRF